MTTEAVTVEVYSDDSLEILSPSGSITIKKVPDGHTIQVMDRHGTKVATYSMDRMKQNQWVLYRMDRKPTVRTHRVVDSADVRVWVRENLDNLLKESGAMA